MNRHGESLHLFHNTCEAVFERRLNRFTVECELQGRRELAYLPNPGRLRELLLPGRRLILTGDRRRAGSRLRHTAVAVEREGSFIMLHTHRANDVVEWLLKKRLVPGFEDAVITGREVSRGRSRFDFLLIRDGKPFLLEVKSCTLFERSIAMFPDAVTQRGERHLRELSGHVEEGTPAGVLFLVQWPRARYFFPDYHTDPAFARTFVTVKDMLTCKPIAVEWERDLSLKPRVTELSIPWHVIESEARDRGSYLLILHVPEGGNIGIGKLGTIAFSAGHYIYVGSAQAGLTKRIERHLRKRKRFHWHIDYLRERADRCTALPIRSSARLECDLAAAVGMIARAPVPGFGSSNCRCHSHLFAMDGDPLDDPRFIDIVQRFRMGRLEPIIEAAKTY
ncbi:MAG: DNA/RNA nuclease SfsA [Deltaproteobacteria bacterium]|nr:DNA/RNA nuclease SfsA [Deltaproteobacteria bacterium]